MSEENLTQGLRQKNIDETRNYLIEEINRNELMSKKHINVCFVSLVEIPVRITAIEVCNWIKTLIKTIY